MKNYKYIKSKRKNKVKRIYHKTFETGVSFLHWNKSCECYSFSSYRNLPISQKLRTFQELRENSFVDNDPEMNYYGVKIRRCRTKKYIPNSWDAEWVTSWKHKESWKTNSKRKKQWKYE